MDAQNDAGLFFSCGGRGCEVPLEGGVTYYLRAPAAQVFGVVLGVGPEGTAFAPIAVPIDADVVMRWDEDEVNSFYAFTPQTYGPHTLRFSGVLPTRGQLEITQDVGATRRLVGRVFFRDTVEVIDDVLAGVPVLINVAPDDGAHAFHMRVEEGDTVAQVVPLDGTPTAITLPAGASINGEVPVQIFSDRVQPIRINFFNPSGPMRREVRSRASSPLERSCETFFRNDEECSLEIPGRFGTAYATILDLENVGASLTMSAVPVAPSELTVDVPVTNEVMPRGGSHWYHFVADSERRAHTITLRFVDRSATFTIRHSDADVLQFTTQTFTGGAGSVHTLQIPNAAGLTPGEHLVHVFPSSSQVGDVIYDFEVEKTP